MMTNNVWWMIFGAAFVVTAVVETFHPFRRLSSSTLKRWTNNSILFALSSAVLLCVYQLSGIVLASEVQASRHGALNRVSLPYTFRFAIGFLAVDLTAYLGHRLFHAFGFLWRIHQVHHTETDLDLTTGFRFHPLEGLITQGYALIVIALLGPPPVAVLCASLAIVLQDFFEHANVRFPRAMDSVLRSVIITAPMHRVHHSEVFTEQNTNFGTIFSIWDRIFGTYFPPQSSDAEVSRCGLPEVKEGSNLSIFGLLILPFRRAQK
jgi:sterol desaturase/sphingolipid hydroxylase (fatty acid hydroxylase superfamily)